MTSLSNPQRDTQLTFDDDDFLRTHVVAPIKAGTVCATTRSAIAILGSKFSGKSHMLDKIITMLNEGDHVSNVKLVHIEFGHDSYSPLMRKETNIARDYCRAYADRIMFQDDVRRSQGSNKEELILAYRSFRRGPRNQTIHDWLEEHKDRTVVLLIDDLPRRGLGLFRGPTKGDREHFMLDSFVRQANKHVFYRQFAQPV
jgi:hypothetical protein